MESHGLVSDALRITIYMSSFGLGYFGAVVVERNRYHALMVSSHLTALQRIKLLALIVLAGFVCHYVGALMGSIMAALCSVGLLELLRATKEIHEAVGVGLVFVVSGISACIGTGYMISSMWRENRRHFPPSEGPLKGA